MDRHPLRQDHLPGPDPADQRVGGRAAVDAVDGDLNSRRTVESANAPLSPSQPSLIAPLATWLVLQLLFLIVAASEARWSADYPTPGHGMALEFMLVTQVVTATLLLRYIC